MNRLPDFGDELVNSAMRDIDRSVSDALVNGVSVVELGGDCFMQAVCFVASCPRAVRRKCYRWLARHALAF
jgi:hypothetical protein